MTTRIASAQSGNGVDHASGNFGSGFVVGGIHGAAIDYGSDNAKTSILGDFYLPQQWLFTGQTMNWWPPQFVAGDMTVAPAVQDQFAPLYQSIGFNGNTAYGIGAL